MDYEVQQQSAADANWRSKIVGNACKLVEEIYKLEWEVDEWFRLEEFRELFGDLIAHFSASLDLYMALVAEAERLDAIYFAERNARRVLELVERNKEARYEFGLFAPFLPDFDAAHIWAQCRDEMGFCTTKNAVATVYATFTAEVYGAMRLQNFLFYAELTGLLEYQYLARFQEYIDDLVQ